MPVLLALAILFFAEPSLAVGPADALAVDGRRARTIVVFPGDPAPRVVEMADRLGRDLHFPMVRAAAGVLGVLEGMHVAQLARSLGPAAAPALEGAGPPLFTFQLVGRRSSRRLGVHRAGASGVLLDGAAIVASIDLAGLEDVLFGVSAPTYRGPCAEPPAAPVEARRGPMPEPLVAAMTVMDEATMKGRLYRGMNVLNPATDRDLAEASMHVRVPSGYTPRAPAGLLVWCSPTPRGDVPRHFDVILDELNMIGVGVDDAGNRRDAQDRFQLMFDAVATAQRHFHVDERRVYIAGLSGGGKVSSILAICFPDVFRGAIPIVGLGTHHALDDSWQEHRQPYFAVPRGRMLGFARDVPIAPISGPADFNYEEMKERTRLLEKDRFARVQFFEDAAMGHTMPPVALLEEALRFIDAPARAARALQVEAADQSLAAYVEARGGALPPTSRSERDRLVHVMTVGPFTSAGWRAWDLLAAAGHALR